MMKAGYVYIAFADNGYEFGNPKHEDSILGVFTEEVYAELFLFDKGFQDRDSEGFWRGREFAWIERHEICDSYINERNI
mgnify:CR=1 FL=1|jgi:hypothetical protein